MSIKYHQKNISGVIRKNDVKKVAEAFDTMENIIKSMIEKAIYYKENLSLYDESRELLQFVAQLIEQMALTINCPSNWRSIGTELAEEYKDNTWIFDELELRNYEE